MVFEAARASAVLGSRPPVFMDALLAEAFVGMPIVLVEVKVVLDERSADQGVVADTIAAHSRVC